MPVEEQKYGRPGEVADIGLSNMRLLTSTEKVMTEEYNSCKAGCYENKYGLEKTILENLKIQWKFKLLERVSGN